MRKKKKTKRVDPIDGAGGETQLELVPFCSAVPFTQLAFACSPRSGTDGDSRAKPHLKITCTAHLACLLLGSPSRRGGWCWWCWCWRWWRVRRRSARVRVCVCVCACVRGTRATTSMPSSSPGPLAEMDLAQGCCVWTLHHLQSTAHNESADTHRHSQQQTGQETQKTGRACRHTDRQTERHCPNRLCTPLLLFLASPRLSVRLIQSTFFSFSLPLLPSSPLPITRSNPPAICILAN